MSQSLPPPPPPPPPFCVHVVKVFTKKKNNNKNNNDEIKQKEKRDRSRIWNKKDADADAFVASDGCMINRRHVFIECRAHTRHSSSVIIRQLNIKGLLYSVCWLVGREKDKRRRRRRSWRKDDALWRRVGAVRAEWQETRVSQREKKKNHYETSFATVFLVIFTTHCVSVCVCVCLSTLSCGAGRELEEESDNKNKESLLSLMRPHSRRTGQ